MSIDFKYLLIPAAYILLRKKKKALSRMLPTKGASGKSTPLSPGSPAPIPSQDAVTAFMAQEIDKYGTASCWGEDGKRILRTAKDLLGIDPKKAFATLQTLPEDQRQAFAKLIYSEIKQQSSSEIAGILGWYYLNFGGNDPELIKKAQKGFPLYPGLRVPVTGVLDQETRAAIEKYSQLAFWKPTLAFWRLS